MKVTVEQIMQWASEIETNPEINPKFLAAIALTESSLNPYAISVKKAMGLFQFMPITVRDIRDRLGYNFTDPFDPEQSTKAAKVYLAWLFRHFSDKNKVLAAWNWGYGNVKTHTIYEYPTETKNFITKVDYYFSELLDSDN